MKLSGAAVTRILEELRSCNAKLHREVATDYRIRNVPKHSYGDDHRAIEDFVFVIVNEILVAESRYNDTYAAHLAICKELGLENER